MPMTTTASLTSFRFAGSMVTFIEHGPADPSWPSWSWQWSGSLGTEGPSFIDTPGRHQVPLTSTKWQSKWAQRDKEADGHRKSLGRPGASSPGNYFEQLKSSCFDFDGLSVWILKSQRRKYLEDVLLACVWNVPQRLVCWNTCSSAATIWEGCGTFRRQSFAGRSWSMEEGSVELLQPGSIFFVPPLLPEGRHTVTSWPLILPPCLPCYG